MSVFRHWVAALSILSASGKFPLFAQTEADFGAVAQRIQGWVDRGYYPGASILVAQDGRVIYESSFGDHTPDTVVLIASAGKWLAAAGIMSLVDEGKLSLDDPASKWLPELRHDPKGRATIRQMLSHTSGYRPYQPDDRPVDEYQTLVESVQHIVPLPLVFEPGQRFDYGGLAMQVAGRMAEVADGRDWEALGEWREELDEQGRAVLLSSPSWAGAYPWIDKTTGVHGVFLTHVNEAVANREKFSSFYTSPELAQTVRDAVTRTSGTELVLPALERGIVQENNAPLRRHVSQVE